MGLFRQKAVTATIDDHPLRCIICGCPEFGHRQIKLNSTGLEFLDLGWANQSALGLICANCGYVHEFVGGRVNMWPVEADS